MTGRGRFPHARRRGAALLETALTLPLLVVLICAAVDFARVACARVTLQRAVEDSLNYATQWKSAGEFPTADEVRAHFNAALMPPLDAASVKIQDLSLGQDAGTTSLRLHVAVGVPLYTPVLAGMFPGSTVEIAAGSQLLYPVDLGGTMTVKP
jgi:Flp pilus assembly protein TadG